MTVNTIINGQMRGMRQLVEEWKTARDNAVNAPKNLRKDELQICRLFGKLRRNILKLCLSISQEAAYFLEFLTKPHKG